MALRVIGEDQAFTALAWWPGHWWFETVYHGTLVAALLLMFGWRTRATSAFFMVGVLSLEFRAPYLGDGGDSVFITMAIYLVLTRCGEVWSLDARRRRPGADDRSGPLLWQLTGVLLGLVFGLPDLGWTGLLWALWAGCGLQFAADRWFPRHEARILLAHPDASPRVFSNSVFLNISTSGRRLIRCHAAHSGVRYVNHGTSRSTDTRRHLMTQACLQHGRAESGRDQAQRRQRLGCLHRDVRRKAGARARGDEVVVLEHAFLMEHRNPLECAECIGFEPGRARQRMRMGRASSIGSLRSCSQARSGSSFSGGSQTSAVQAALTQAFQLLRRRQVIQRDMHRSSSATTTKY